MRSQKAFLFAAVVLIMASTANADLILTLNGLDATKQPLKIEGKNNLIIAVAGQTQVNANDYSVTASGGTLKAHTGGYLFTFEDQSSVGTVNLIVNNDMIINGVFVVAGGTIYQLVLFYIPETDTVIVFGINLEALNFTPPPQPEQQTPPKQQVSAPQATTAEKSYFATMSAGRTTGIDSFPDPNSYPDINNDDIVNFIDFSIFAANWQQSGSSLDGDFDNSGVVDTNDLAILAYFWLNGPHPVDVFESFKNALLADDVNEAVTFFTEISAENYRPLLEQLRPYFEQMVNDMGELIFIRFDNDMVVYDLLRQEDSQTYGYPVIFIRNEMCQWKIYDF